MILNLNHGLFDLHIFKPYIYYGVLGTEKKVPQQQGFETDGFCLWEKKRYRSDPEKNLYPDPT